MDLNKRIYFLTLGEHHWARPSILLFGAQTNSLPIRLARLIP